MRIAACSAIYKGYSMEQALAGIARAGFQFVEVAAMPGWCEHVDPRKPETVLALKTALKQTGLKLTALAGHCNMVDGKQRAKLMDTIALAREMGCDFVITSPGGDASERDEMLRALREVDECCAAHGVGLALEPHGALAGAALLGALIEEAGTKCVSVNYDTANVIFFAGLDPLKDIKAAKGFLSYVHLKDKRGPKGVWDFPPLGRGELDFSGILAELRNIGYDGSVSVEIEYTPDAEHTVAELDADVKESLAYLNKLIQTGGMRNEQ